MQVDHAGHHEFACKILNRRTRRRFQLCRRTNPGDAAIGRN
jgi:hypothetical protein